MSPFVPLFPSSISFPFLCCKSHLRAFVCYIRQDTRIRGWGVKPIFPLPAFSEHLAMHSIPQKKVQFPAHPSSTPFGDHLVYLPVVLLVNHLNDSHNQQLHYKILPSGLCAEICRNRGQKDFQVVSGFFPGPRYLFWSRLEPFISVLTKCRIS